MGSMTFIVRRATLAATLLLAGLTGAAAQDATTGDPVKGDPVKGAALLTEARKALGGEEKLRAVKTLQAKGDFKRMAGTNTIEGELELLVGLPDKLRRNEDLSLPGGGPAVIRTEVLNGTEVWEENTGGGQFVFRRGGDGRGGGRGDRAGAPGQDQPGGRAGRGPVDPEQLRQFQLRARQADLARFALALLLTTNDPVAWVGIAESPDGKADVLEVTPAQGPATRLFLDASTHLPLMLGPASRRRSSSGDAAAAAAATPPPLAISRRRLPARSRRRCA
jgi:hypothetical protein